MTRKNNSYHILPITLILLTILLGSCGRKHNNFLDFSDKKREPKFNRLSLPAVQNLTVKKDDLETSDRITLRWKHITNANYNIYRFIKTAFIPKNPINKTPITTTHYIDKLSSTEKTCYLVRPVFTVKGKKITGPGSKIVCI